MSNAKKGEQKNDKNKKDTTRKILIIIAILLLLIGGIMIAYNNFGGNIPEKINVHNPVATTPETPSKDADGKIDNPIDFATITAKNDEIYAWLIVPDTEVNYPILQSKISDDFYLRHKAEDKSYASSGAIYTQSLNTKTFKDRVTVIYGHNGYGTTMFTTLHKFENSEFFKSHKEFYIYTPDSKLTYTVVSAFKYDDRHILNSFDFQNDDIFYQFLVNIQCPKSSNQNVNESLDKELTIDDNIVVLSTCITGQKGNRYLVCGVLTKNEKTN